MHAHLYGGLRLLANIDVCGRVNCFGRPRLLHESVL